MERLEILNQLNKIINDITETELELDENDYLRVNKKDRRSVMLSSIDIVNLIVQTEEIYEIDISNEKIALVEDMREFIDLIIRLLEEKQTECEEMGKVKMELFG